MNFKIYFNINMSFKIPLRNINKDIIAYTIVSECDFEILNKLKWHKNKTGYAKGNTEPGLIHRYIYKEIMKIELTPKNIIDHINSDRLDNRRENLRIVNHTENARNHKKQENVTSKYIGVYLNTEINMWISRIKINESVLRASYQNEEHAAHQYNLWCIEYKLITAKLNILSDESIVNFEPYILPVKNGNNLPKGITMISENRYRLHIYKNAKMIHIGYFETVEEANKIRLEKLKEYKEIDLKNHYEKPIKLNKDNQCIIELFNKNKIKTGETIVDEDIYYELTKYTWRLSSFGYVINNTCGNLHRHILNYSGQDVVDHINSNPLDNRKCNLRIVTQQQNTMNKSAQKNGSSKYIGVRFHKKSNKWESNIYVNNKNKYLGLYETEIEAAKARDSATKEYFGEYGKLNFPN